MEKPERWQKLIRRFDFDICTRAPEYETTESRKHTGKFIIVDYADSSMERFCIVGNNPEQLAQECAEFWELETIKKGDQRQWKTKQE